MIKPCRIHERRYFIKSYLFNTKISYEVLLLTPFVCPFLVIKSGDWSKLFRQIKGYQLNTEKRCQFFSIIRTLIIEDWQPVIPNDDRILPEKRVIDGLISLKQFWKAPEGMAILSPTKIRNVKKQAQIAAYTKGKTKR